MDVTPYIYTEGPYNTRLKFLTDVPKGKVFYHFENVDMAEAKRVLGDTAAICGNLSISRMEFGKKEDTSSTSMALWKTANRRIWRRCLRRWINMESIKAVLLLRAMSQIPRCLYRGV